MAGGRRSSRQSRASLHLISFDDAHEIGHEPSDEADGPDRPRVVHASRTDDADVPHDTPSGSAVPPEHEAAIEQRLDAVLPPDRDVDLALAARRRQQPGDAARVLAPPAPLAPPSGSVPPA